jgi:hypothetical protein
MTDAHPVISGELAGLSHQSDRRVVAPHTQRSDTTMPITMTFPGRRITSALAAIALMLGLTLATAPNASAVTPSKKTYLQTLVAYEKLSYDVFTSLAAQHPRGPFRLLAQAERRDLIRMRQLLRSAGWRDLTRGNGPGQFRHFPLLEQTYWDMTGNGQSSVGDAARVGIALQQLSLGLIYELLDSRLTARERTHITYSRTYAINRLAILQETIRRAG